MIICIFGQLQLNVVDKWACEAPLLVSSPIWFATTSLAFFSVTNLQTHALDLHELSTVYSFIYIIKCSKKHLADHATPCIVKWQLVILCLAVLCFYWSVGYADRHKDVKYINYQSNNACWNSSSTFLHVLLLWGKWSYKETLVAMALVIWQMYFSCHLKKADIWHVIEQSLNRVSRWAITSVTQCQHRQP